MKRCVVLVLALLLVGAHARVAEAEPQTAPAAAQAQVLFYKARALMQQGRYAEACPALEASVHLEAGIGTRFNLADCNEHIGKLASAWAGFVDVAAAAGASHQTDREAVARKRARALEARIPKLVVDVTRAPAGLEVTRDGVAIAASNYGVEVAVDPGDHHVKATAPGKHAWETDVHMEEGKVVHVAVPSDLAPVERTMFVNSAATPEAPTDPEGAPRAFPAAIVEPASSPQRIAGWVLAGAGVVGVGIGAGFGLASINDRNGARDHCTGDRCDSDGVSMRQDAISNGNIATISMIAGGAAIAGGLLLVLTTPTKAEPSPSSSRLRAVPNVASAGGGVLLEGSFR
jgi:hypothetical protein